jgi:hypothetical protein
LSATIVELSEAIVETLNLSSNQETFGRTFEAKRGYTAETKLSDSDKKLHVWVVPITMDFGNATRNSTIKQPIIEVSFITRPPSDFTFMWLDELLECMEAVGNLFRRTRFTMDAGDIVSLPDVEMPLVYDYDGLREGKLFVSYLTLKFRREH